MSPAYGSHPRDGKPKSQSNLGAKETYQRFLTNSIFIIEKGKKKNQKKENYVDRFKGE